MKALVTGATDDTRIQLFRYLVVGFAAFCLDLGTLWALTALVGLHYLASAALGFCVGLTMNYLLSVSWVFSRRAITSRSAEFGVFAAIGALGLVLNELVMWGLTDGAGLHYLASKICATIVVFGWNFGARKLALFS